MNSYLKIKKCLRVFVLKYLQIKFGLPSLFLKQTYMYRYIIIAVDAVFTCTNYNCISYFVNAYVHLFVHNVVLSYIYVVINITKVY